MKRISILFAVTAGFTSALIQGIASAQSSPMVNNLTEAQIQRITSDLNHSSSDDFFHQGREKLEEEVQRLQQQRLLQNLRILKIENTNIQSNHSQFEHPKRCRS